MEYNLPIISTFETFDEFFNRDENKNKFTSKYNFAIRAKNELIDKIEFLIRKLIAGGETGIFSVESIIEHLNNNSKIIEEIATADSVNIEPKFQLRLYKFRYYFLNLYFAVPIFFENKNSTFYELDGKYIKIIEKLFDDLKKHNDHNKFIKLYADVIYDNLKQKMETFYYFSNFYTGHDFVKLISKHWNLNFNLLVPYIEPKNNNQIMTPTNNNHHNHYNDNHKYYDSEYITHYDNFQNNFNHMEPYYHVQRPNCYYPINKDPCNPVLYNPNPYNSIPYNPYEFPQRNHHDILNNPREFVQMNYSDFPHREYRVVKASKPDMKFSTRDNYRKDDNYRRDNSRRREYSRSRDRKK